MEKTLTLNDLQHYLQEINKIEKAEPANRRMSVGPSDFTLQTILRYSSALSILKTRTAGTIYQLAN